MAIRKTYVDGRHGQIHVRHNSRGAQAGKPLICLHATAYSSQTFVPLLTAYDGIRHVIAIDAPGYGGSDAPERPIDMAGYAEAMLTVVASLCDGAVDVLGYHTGAYIAAQMALLDEARIDTLVLIGVPYFQALDFDEWRARLSARHKLEDRLDQFAERWAYLVADRPAGLSLTRAFENFVDELRAWPNGWWAHEAMFNWPSRKLLPQISQPVLIINPDGHLAAASRAAAELMLDVHVVEMPDLSGPVFEQAPGRIMAEIQAFAGLPAAA